MILYIYLISVYSFCIKLPLPAVPASTSPASAKERLKKGL